MKPWCVFYGTRTALVIAPTEPEAFTLFLQLAFPIGDQGGRYVPPGRDEVNIRELRADDAGWIEEFHGRGAAPFLAALKDVDA